MKVFINQYFITMKSDFFPTDNYEIPKSPSNYMKLEDDRNKFRVLSSAIVGFEYWNTQNKPVRSATAFEEMPDDIRLEKDGKPSKIKHFWAFVVWNYDTNRVQILELTQKSIMTGIKALVDDPAWGNPNGYDIVITKKGDGLDTEYSVMPNPHTMVSEEVMNAYKPDAINLPALFKGEDPFVIAK